jgi:hypothetical protein
MVSSSKLNKEAKHALEMSLTVLEHAMTLALQKEDLDVIIAISDRMMMLYQHLSDRDVVKFKAGFSLANLNKSKELEDDESD